MSTGKDGTLRAASDAGLSGEHPVEEPFQFLVGPATGNEFNTARLRLIPIACWQVDDVRFAFDSSFVEASEIEEELALLSTLVRDHPEAPLSVFGHADPVGSDDYNKLLSGRRAMAIYALLISNTEPAAAVKLWRQISATEKWGTKEREAMGLVTGLPSGTPDDALIQAYLKKLCPPDLKLGKKDFLARGADPQGKGDFQGCGEFNPLLLFSVEQQAEFDRARQQKDEALLQKRNAANAPNRRVMVLLFRKGSQVIPSRWPCPRANEGVAGCLKRFWSDGEQRRSRRLPGKLRKFEDSGDTFGCRFYQRITSRSPCDRILGAIRIRLFDSFGQVLPHAPFVVVSGADQSKPRIADSKGEITLRDIGAGVVTIKWSRPRQRKQAKPPEEIIVIGRDGVERPEQTPEPPPDQFEFERDVVITVNKSVLEVTATPETKMTEDGARARLNNLGYLVGDQLSDLIRAFERDCDLLETGKLSDEVIAKLREFHDVKVESPGFSPGIVTGESPA